MSYQHIALHPYATTNVSTLTAVLAFERLPKPFNNLYITMDNTDGVNTVWLRVEQSSDGVYVDIDSPPELEITASKSGTIVIPRANFRSYYRISAYTLTPGFPTVSIKWRVVMEVLAPDRHM